MKTQQKEDQGKKGVEDKGPKPKSQHEVSAPKPNRREEVIDKYLGFIYCP